MRMSRFEPKQADEPLRIETSGSAPKQTVASRYGAGEPLGGLAATKRLRRCTVIPFNPLFFSKACAPARVLSGSRLCGGALAATATPPSALLGARAATLRVGAPLLPAPCCGAARAEPHVAALAPLLCRFQELAERVNLPHGVEPPAAATRRG